MNRFEQLDRNQPVLIFGAGGFAKSLADALRQVGIEVAGFISAKPASAALSGCPVKTWSSLASAPELQRLPLLCGIFNRDHAYQELNDIARSYGFEAMLMPWDYYPALAPWLGWRYWLSERPETLKSMATWPAVLQNVHALLHDDESKQLLRRLFAFRAGTDLAYSRVRSQETQYFNALTLPEGAKCEELVYLDVGAYDGDTLSAITAQAKLSRALLFEPCQCNLEKLRAHVTCYLNDNPWVEVDVMPLALSDHASYGVLSGQGEAASLNADALDELPKQDALVHAVRADDLYPSLTVDFVKIDAEGADLACIKGMARMLSRSRPVVAVAAYHRELDLINIPLALDQILGHQGYRYYIRQHQFNSFDCVFYAVPER